MFGAKAYLLQRWIARRDRVVPVSRLVGGPADLTEHPPTGADPKGSVSSQDLGRLPAGEPVPAAALFARVLPRLGGPRAQSQA